MKGNIENNKQMSSIQKCHKCGKHIEINTENGRVSFHHCEKGSREHSISQIQSFRNLAEDRHDQQFDDLSPPISLRQYNSEDNHFQEKNLDKKIHKAILKLSSSLPLQVQDQSSDQQLVRLQEEQKKFKQMIRMNKLKLNADKKVIVGSGFTFDMTDFFKFKKKELGVDGKPSTFFQEISGSRVAWVILLYTICSGALIPGWIMNIQANKILRQCWRFLMQVVFLLPFILSEKRTISQQNKQKYTLKYIFNPQNIIKPYISSLSGSLWFLFVLSSFQWTYVSHGLVLGGLSNFFLSIGRSINKSSHDLQAGGQVLVILGVLLVIHDSLSVQRQQIPLETYQYLNIFYLHRTWWERLGGDLLAIFTSYIMSQFSRYTSDLRTYYPPFLSMFLVNSFNIINLLFMAFFFQGATFDFDPYWGIFSVINESHFVSFMYMAIVLAFGQMISVFLITKMFPDPIIPALAMTLQPFLACFFVALAKIQNLPGNFAMIGFILIFPGMLLVLMGQCFYQKKKQNNQQVDRRVKQLQEENTLLKQKQKEKKTYIQQKKRLRSSQSLIIQDRIQHTKH